MKKIYYCTNCEKWRGDNEECPKCGEETEKKELPSARGDYYFIDGEDTPYLRTTHILDKVLPKPGLEYWKRQKSVEKALETLDKKKAMGAIYEKRDKAGKSGSEIHGIIHDILSDQDVDWETVNKIPKIKAWQKFADDFDWDRTLGAEVTVHDDELKIAGTLDALIEKDGEKIIVDWKTGNNVYDEVQLQLSAYAHMIDEDIDRLLVVHLKDETYDMLEYEPDFDTFRAILKVYKWLN